MTIDLAGLRLARGSHDRPESGVCLMEAVAWWAGETHSDHPACVSPVLAAFGRRLNDHLPDTVRQQLVDLIPALAGTAGDGHDQARMYRCADFAVRTMAPIALDARGHTDHAETLRTLPPIVDRETALAGRAAAADAAAAAYAAAAYAAADAATAAAAAAAADAAVDAYAYAAAATDAADAYAAVRQQMIDFYRTLITMSA